MTEISVFVASRGGNTQKVADAIAEELGVMVGDIGGSLPDDSKIIFLGSGVYGGKPGSAMTEFIGRGDFTGRKVALFATSGAAEGAKNMISMVADAVKRERRHRHWRLSLQGEISPDEPGSPLTKKTVKKRRSLHAGCLNIPDRYLYGT
jgi:Flavodoxins